MRRRLPVLQVVRDALVLLWTQRAVLLHALLMPAALLTLLGVGQELLEESASQFLLSVAKLPIEVMYLSSCHRVALVGPTSLPSRWGLYWTPRETRFLGYLVLLYVVAGLLGMLLTPLGAAAPWVLQAGAVGVSILAMYLVSRLSLVLPATAIGLRLDVGGAWRLSEGNGWRLMLATVLSMLALVPFGVLAAILIALLPGHAGEVVASLCAILLSAVTVLALSVAYRELSTRS